MLELFGEVGGEVPEYFLSDQFFDKWHSKKLLWKISSKTLTAGVFWVVIGALRDNLVNKV